MEEDQGLQPHGIQYECIQQPERRGSQEDLQQLGIITRYFWRRSKQSSENVANTVPRLRPSGPAPKGKTMLADPNSTRKPKIPGGALETEDAVTVKPRPNPKKHPEDKNNKGKQGIC